MRALLLLLAVQATADPAAVEKQALVAKVMSAIEREVDFNGLAREVTARIHPAITAEARNRKIGEIEQVLRKHFGSRPFLERTVGAWLERRFTTDELQELADLAETRAGRGALAKMIHFNDEMAELAMRELGDELRQGADSTRGSEPAHPTGARRVGGNVRPPRAIHRVDPQYPPAAREARVQGMVILELIIDESGSVREARILKGLPYGMDQAALDAVRQWRFEPGTQEGRPVAVIFNVTVAFRLADSG